MVMRKRRFHKKYKKNIGYKSYVTHRTRALELAHAKIAKFNTTYQFAVNKVSVKNQKTRWGSCSAKGNLNFNYRIALLPEHLSDYVIVHELCHLGVFNHSAAFWQLIEKTIPNWRSIKREFEKIYITT